MSQIIELKPPQPIYAKHGRNIGKKICVAYFRRNYPTYVLVEKTILFRAPSLKIYMWLSHTAIEDAIQLGVKLIIFQIVDFEIGRSIYIVFDIKEFINSKKIIRFEGDPQKGVLWGNKPRFYSFPKSLWEFIKKEKND